MSKSDRLKEARKAAGFSSAAEAARSLGVKEPTYAGHENGARDFDDESAAIYARRYRVRPEWLIYGTGPMSNSSSEPTIVSIEEAERNGGGNGKTVSAGVRYQGSERGVVPELDAAAGAGDGKVGDVLALGGPGISSGHAVTQEWGIPPAMQRHWLGAAPGRLVILPVEGDSMLPTLEAGDRVAIDLGSTTPRDGGLYVIDEGLGPMVKRVQLLPGTDPLEIEIISDNPRVPARRRPADTVYVIGRVRGRWSRI